MPPKKSFDEFFKNELSETLLPLEEQRKKVSQVAFIGFALVGMALVFFFIYSAGQSEGLNAVAIIAFVAAIIVLIVYYYKRKDYVSTFKEKIVRRIINFIDSSLDYDPSGFISENDYGNSGLFLKTADRYDGDDYVIGKRDKTTFCFSELHTQYKVSSGKNTHWVTIFKGIFFIADFNKNFSGRTYVWSEENPQLSFFSNIFSSFAAGVEKVKLESSEFERRFIVYSSDQVESRYVLTPSFMERMVKLHDMMGSGISFSFVNANINVAVPIRDAMFEPSIFSANDYQKLGDYYNTVHIVFDIIDELKLNQRLWNKE